MVNFKSVKCENLGDKVKFIVQIGDDTISCILSDVHVSTPETEITIKQFSDEKVAKVVDQIKTVFSAN